MTLTATERRRARIAYHESGHTIAATALGGRIARSVISDSPQPWNGGHTAYLLVPEGSWARIVYGGPYAEAKFLGRRVGDVLASTGGRDMAELTAAGGVHTGAYIAPVLDRCWSAVKVVAHKLYHLGEVDYHAALAALGLSEATAVVGLPAIRSGTPPDELRITLPAAA